MNTAAVEDPKLITQLSEEFGSQAVVLAIDAPARRKRPDWQVFTYGGRKRENLSAVEWAVRRRSQWGLEKSC